MRELDTSGNDTDADTRSRADIHTEAGAFAIICAETSTKHTRTH